MHVQVGITMGTHKKISQRARKLLASGENSDVDYKRDVGGLHPEDLAAFANSPKGGAIMVGVREARSSDGSQRGEIVGHPIDDGTRLKIIQKAQYCSPPVHVEIHIENGASKPFLRIEVPSGTQKPYSTADGTYKIRGDGRNNPLLPEQLLKLFLEREGMEFAKRFTEATAELDEQMYRAVQAAESVEDVVHQKLGEISDLLGWAESKAGETANVTKAVSEQVDSLYHYTKDQSLRVRALMEKVGASDPIKSKTENEIRTLLRKELKNFPDALARIEAEKKLRMEISGPYVDELTEEDLQNLVKEVVKELKGKRE